MWLRVTALGFTVNTQTDTDRQTDKSKSTLLGLRPRGGGLRPKRHILENKGPHFGGYQK